MRRYSGTLFTNDVEEAHVNRVVNGTQLHVSNIYVFGSKRLQ